MGLEGQARRLIVRRAGSSVTACYMVPMSHFWLCYRDNGQRFNVIIIEAASLIRARLKAALAGRDKGMIFTEGHELSAELSPLVQSDRILSADEAMKLLNRLERAGGRRAAKK
jgi:hypothetical protein